MKIRSAVFKGIQGGILLIMALSMFVFMRATDYYTEDMAGNVMAFTMITFPISVTSEWVFEGAVIATDKVKKHIRSRKE